MAGTGLWFHAQFGGRDWVGGPVTGGGKFKLLAAGIRAYPTQAAAQAAPAQPLTAAQVQVLEKLSLAGPGIGQGFFGLGGDAGQAWKDVTGPADALARLGAELSDWRMWASLGWLALGLVLIVAGLRLWLGKSAAPVPAAVPVPV